MARGSSHSAEGVVLEEVTLRTGEAVLAVQGALLGARQDASVLLTDFPVALLQPVLRALPALEHAAPAVPPAGVDCSHDALSFVHKDVRSRLLALKSDMACFDCCCLLGLHKGLLWPSTRYTSGLLLPDCLEY